MIFMLSMLKDSLGFYIWASLGLSCLIPTALSHWLVCTKQPWFRENGSMYKRLGVSFSPSLPPRSLAPLSLALNPARPLSLSLFCPQIFHDAWHGRGRGEPREVCTIEVIIGIIWMLAEHSMLPYEQKHLALRSQSASSEPETNRCSH